MVLSTEDVAAITQIVATTLAQMGGGAAMAVGGGGGRKTFVEERYFRKIPTFDGKGWKDFAFQFKSAARSSGEKVYDMLVYAEQEVDEID